MKAKKLFKSYRSYLLLVALALVATSVQGQQQQPREAASGPLRVDPLNSRYFTDGAGKAIYLTGSHTWASLQDCGLDVGRSESSDPPPEFDFDAYLKLLTDNNHNFIRLWRWELPRTVYGSGADFFSQPQPWCRTGPAVANDGKPKYDLTQFDESYFDRMRSRIIAAGDRGIYVSIMLFEGWYLSGASKSWQYHPMNSSNNVNEINGDANGNGVGEETNSNQIPAVVELQRAYVRKVVDTVNDLDNVLYEIANESAVPGSTEWQYDLIRTIQSYEAGKPKQHPVGMTCQAFHLAAKHDLLWDSPADWISLGQVTTFDNAADPYINDPPMAVGGKVSLLDSDHLGWKVYVDDANLSRAWVWKSFLRGHNPLLMENLKDNSGWIAARAAMGHTRSFANKMDIAEMTPQDNLATTGYCLASAGHEYLVYQPDEGELSVNLAPGSYEVEWFNPLTGVVVSTASLSVAGDKQTFVPPFTGPAVLYLKQASVEQSTGSFK
ncbi:MAG: hypothetical protein IT422_04475 [Pirellulaceae bacterium]|jgi:hypothetical protein|nr:hypothetical protein [Pirellulaceae bacterium]